MRRGVAKEECRLRAKYISLTWALLAFGLTSHCLADDTFLGASAQGAYPLSSKDIALVLERVSVVLSRRSAEVDCVFVFRNNGPAQEALIGFPEGPLPGPEQRGDTRLHSFRAWVEGRRVSVRIQPASAPGRAIPGLRVTRWHTFRVRFARGQVRTVRNCYWVHPSEHSLGGVRFNYILTTARTWKDEKIGQAQIRVRLADLDRGKSDLIAGLALVRPDGYRLGRNSISWQLSDFVPTEDVQIAYEARLRHWRARLARVSDSAEQGNLKLLIGEVLFNYDADKARIAFGRALQLATSDSRRAACEFWIGKCYEKDANRSLALQHYDQAIKLDPQGQWGEQARSVAQALRLHQKNKIPSLKEENQ